MIGSVELACEICYHLYNTSDRLPLILKECGHTFCSPCILNQLKKEKTKIVCPACRKTTSAKKISDFPKNFLVIKLLEYQMTSQSSAFDSQSLNLKKRVENNQSKKQEIAKERRVSFSDDIEVIEVFSQSQKKLKTENKPNKKSEPPQKSSSRVVENGKQAQDKKGKDNSKKTDDIVIFIEEENILKTSKAKKAETIQKKKPKKLFMEDETEVEDDNEMDEEPVVTSKANTKMKPTLSRKPTKLFMEEDNEDTIQTIKPKAPKGKKTPSTKKLKKLKEVVVDDDDDDDEEEEDEVEEVHRAINNGALSKRNFYIAMFTGFDKNDAGLERDQKKLKSLGVRIVEDIGQPFNVLVMDKFKRTIKFLFALNKGIDIVSYKWVKDSIKEGFVLPTSNYIFTDKAAEARFNFKISTSLQKAKLNYYTGQLFQKCISDNIINL